MNKLRHIPVLMAVLLAAGPAAAVAIEGEWVSYRDAYRAMVVFEKYGKPKSFLQNHLQVMPREKGISVEGMRLSLNGKTTQLSLPLDATGRAVFPLLKSAYDDNAELVINRKVSQYVFRSRVSIVVRPDGVYELADLRAACEQLLAYQRQVEAQARSLHCVGVRFAYARRAPDILVKLRRDGAEQVLSVVDGAPFQDDPNDNFQVVSVRIGEADRGQVVTQTAPLSIAALLE
jgi:hypothetical protein